MIYSILMYTLKFIPFLLVIIYTIGFGIKLRKEKKSGFLGIIILILMNMIAFTYVVFLKRN